MAKSKRSSMLLILMLAVFPLKTLALEVIISAEDDVFVAATWPTKNWSTNNILYTARYYGSSEVWLKFDLSSLIPPEGRSLYLNSVILQSFGPSAGTATPVYQDVAYFCDNDTWNESTITWSNRPVTLGEQLVAPWDYAAYTWMNITGDNLIARIEQETMGDHFLSMKVNGASTPTGDGGHYYYDNDYSTNGFRLKVNYTFFPENSGNIVVNPHFTDLDQDGMPVSWSFWFGEPGDQVSIDSTNYSILPFNSRNVLRFDNSTMSWNSFSQTIPVYGGVPYLLSMTHRESMDYDQPFAIGIQYSGGSFIYLDTLIFNSSMI